MIRWLRRDTPVAGRTETIADIARSVDFIETKLSAANGYRFSASAPPTLLATSIGVCALEHLGGLSRLSEERRRRVGRAILDTQREDGLFRDPKHDDALLKRLPKFPPLYVEWQETYFALHALDALGLEPERPLSFIEPFTDRRAMEPWFRTLRFDDIWFCSNLLMFALYFFGHRGDEAAAHDMLDMLDAFQDPETGYWGTKQGASLFNGMAGAFHLYGFYLHLDRPLAHQEAAVRSTLSLQEATGLWSEPGGGPCEDLDAIDILAKLKPAPEDEGAVRRSLERALPALRACRREDGGYRWLSPQPGVRPRDHLYSGMETLRCRSDQGDVWSCWFRPLAIALAEQRLGNSVTWPVTYRRQPLLGWHPPS